MQVRWWWWWRWGRRQTGPISPDKESMLGVATSDSPHLPHSFPRGDSDHARRCAAVKSVPHKSCCQPCKTQRERGVLCLLFLFPFTAAQLKQRCDFGAPITTGLHLWHDRRRLEPADFRLTPAKRQRELLLFWTNAALMLSEVN